MIWAYMSVGIIVPASAFAEKFDVFCMDMGNVISALGDAGKVFPMDVDVENRGCEGGGQCRCCYNEGEVEVHDEVGR